MKLKPRGGLPIGQFVPRSGLFIRWHGSLSLHRSVCRDFGGFSPHSSYGFRHPRASQKFARQRPSPTLAAMFTRAAVFTAVVASAAAFQPTLRAGVAPKVLPSPLQEFRARARGLRHEAGCATNKLAVGLEGREGPHAGMGLATVAQQHQTAAFLGTVRSRCPPPEAGACTGETTTCRVVTHRCLMGCIKGL